MEQANPHQPSTKRDSLEAEIYAAFKGVGREGGTSWSESDVVDDHGSEAACAAARALDREVCWEQLVDGNDWDPDAGGKGSFAFLDPIGFRYYLAPAMLRFMRDGEAGALEQYLCYFDGPERRAIEKRFGFYSPAQKQAVAGFVRCIRDALGSRDQRDHVDRWADAYERYWRTFDSGEIAHKPDTL